MILSGQIESLFLLDWPCNHNKSLYNSLRNISNSDIDGVWRLTISFSFAQGTNKFSRFLIFVTLVRFKYDQHFEQVLYSQTYLRGKVGPEFKCLTMFNTKRLNPGSIICKATSIYGLQLKGPQKIKEEDRSDSAVWRF